MLSCYLEVVYIKHTPSHSTVPFPWQLSVASHLPVIIFTLVRFCFPARRTQFCKDSFCSVMACTNPSHVHTARIAEHEPHFSCIVAQILAHSRDFLMSMWCGSQDEQKWAKVSSPWRTQITRLLIDTIFHGSLCNPGCLEIITIMTFDLQFIYCVQCLHWAVHGFSFIERLSRFWILSVYPVILIINSHSVFERILDTSLVYYYCLSSKCLPLCCFYNENVKCLFMIFIPAIL